MTTRSEVIALLQDNPNLRDDAGATALLHAKIFFDGTFEEFIRSDIQSSITREWREAQEKHPELRGKTWASRQKKGHIVRMQKRHRNLGQYEDCSGIFEPIRVQKETTLQFIYRKLFR